VRTIRTQPFRRISGTSSEGLLYAGTHKGVYKWWDDGDGLPVEILDHGTCGIDGSFIDNGFLTISRAGISLYVYDGECRATRDNCASDGKCTKWEVLARYPNLFDVATDHDNNILYTLLERGIWTFDVL